jgi:glycosyltransferase involved in cell wall biosynthesis
MRIAFVVHDYNRVLGHSRYVSELAGRFSRQHDVHVFANTFAGDTRGITTHHVPAVRATALTTILSFYAAAAVRVGRDFDIVHAQGAVLPSPDIITAHISNARWREARERIEGGRLSWKEKLFAAFVTPLERRALASDRTLVVAVSKALARDIAQTYGRRGEIAVIHHGVDAAQFNAGVRDTLRGVTRRELGLAPETIAHLFVGDLRKGFRQAVEALASARGMLFAVSRSQPDEMLGLAATLGLADRVRVLPPTDHIERYYAAADVFVFPTPYDAFGMVITEALACGLPVITATTAGAAELIEPGRTGLLVDDPSDVGALAAHMRRLAADPIERRRMGENASAAMKKESWDSVAERTMALYERVKKSGRTAVVPSPSS